MRIRALGLSLALLAGSAALPAQANGGPLRVPCPAPKPLATLDSPRLLGESCPGVRPGARLVNPDGGNCTAGFLFARDHSPSAGHANGNVFLSTAGHCLAQTGPEVTCPNVEQTWAAGQGPIESAYDENIATYAIGRWVYMARTCERDIGIIQLFDGVAYDAQMCHFHGPTRVDDGHPINGIVTLHFFGQATGPAQVLPARDAIAQGVPKAGMNYAIGVVSLGDSGSPVVTDDGTALGLIADLAPSLDLAGSGTFSFARLNLPLQRLRNLHLLTAS